MNSAKIFLLVSVALCRPCFSQVSPLPTIEPDFRVTEINGQLFEAGSLAVSETAIVKTVSAGGLVFSRDGEFRLEFQATVPEGSFHSLSDTEAYGHRVVIGANRTGTGGDNPRIGAAYVFDTDTGEQLHRLTFDHVSAGLFSSRFGSTVSINDKYVAMGDHRGRALVFDVETGEEVFQYLPDVQPQFGFAEVDLRGDFLAVTSPGRVVDGELSQAILLFDLPSGEQLVEITTDEPDDDFATNVELGDDRMFINVNGVLQAYDFSGNLVDSFDYRQLDLFSTIGIDSRLRANLYRYSESGYLIHQGTDIVFETSTLTPAFSVHAVTDIFEDQAVALLGDFPPLYQINSYTIPEPSALTICLALLLPLQSLRARRHPS